MSPRKDPSSHEPPTSPGRATCWKLRTQTLTAQRLPLLMGIINVTPDSFSDAGQFAEADAAVDHGLRLAAEGARILDVGGQSTRPGSTPVDADEELRRVMPVLVRLSEQTTVPLSVDTSKAVVAREAVGAGAQIINDVTALGGDPAMLEVALGSDAGLCVMHMQGTPQTMQQNPSYGDVVEDVLGYLRDRRELLEAAGIQRARIALDPGIGFGKTTAHNLALLRHAGRLHELGCPLLVGHSRKRFLGQLIQDAEADRTAATIGVALSLARRGVHVLRVHDVAPLRQALLAFEASGGLA